MFNILSRDKWITPFSFTIIVFWIIFGSMLMVASFFENWQPSPAIGFTPPIIQFFTGLFLFVGGLLVLVSDHDWKKVNTGWALEKVGAIISFGGWIAYTSSAIAQDWKHTGVVLLGIAMAAAILTRYGQVNAQEKFIRMRVNKLWVSGYPRSH